MTMQWTRHQSWVAVFDALGFTNRVEQASKNDVAHEILVGQIEDLLQEVNSDVAQRGKLKSLVFADTIVILTPTAEPRDYPWFLLQCQNLITRSIYLRLPLRGAISIGQTHVAEHHPILLGAPFLEAHRYCDDQDWVGLLLTPSATRALRTAELDPRHHDFVDGPIPLRKCPPDGVLAFRFQSGVANFASPLRRYLREMMQLAPDGAKGKYERTIEHIKKHYRWVGEAGD